MGLENRPATNDELVEMKDLVKNAMLEGALGISTGLFYVPGNFTPTNEIVELSKVAAGYGGIYISHMREEAAEIINSVQETIDCLLYTSPSPRDGLLSRMPSSA